MASNGAPGDDPALDSRGGRSNGRSAPRTVQQDARDFDRSYQGEVVTPWDIDRPQPVFERLAEDRGLVGSVLDVGCGTGEHALLAAAHGHPAVGVDFSPTAIDLARRKAQDRGLQAEFLLHDALRLGELGRRFDTVLDCGLFHGLDDDERQPFVTGLSAVLGAGGRYHLLGFSDLQPGDWGPRRLTETDIRETFTTGWRVDALERVSIDITIEPSVVQAWHATITHLAASPPGGA